MIYATLDDVFDATKSDDFDIDCEGGSGDCADANAYVDWGGSDVNVCNNFFNSGLSASKQAAILIHELTHAYNDTDDYFYYPPTGATCPGTRSSRHRRCGRTPTPTSNSRWTSSYPEVVDGGQV